MTEQKQTGQELRLTILAAGLSIAAVALSGFLYLWAECRTYEAGLFLRLGSIARMKASAVASWRNQRIGDAYATATAAFLMPAVKNTLKGRATAAERAQIAQWLEVVRARYNYEDVTLTGLEGEPLVSVGPTVPGTLVLRECVAKAFRNAGRPYFGDFIKGGTGGAPRINVSLELREPGGERSGALVLGIDPEHEIYPALQDWPGGGRTGKLQLVRRVGDSILYLSDLETKNGGVPTIRQVPARSNLAAAIATSQKTDDIIGEDYRGVVVNAAAHGVDGSGWFVVAKIDGSEAMEPVWAEVRQFVTFLAVVAMLIIAMARLFLRRSAARLYREKYEAEVARQELLGRYDFLARYANDAILVFEVDGKLLEVNDRATEMFGYTRDELLQMSIPELKPAEAAGDVPRVLAELQKTGRAITETRYRRKDGTVLHSEISVGAIELRGTTYYQSIVRDISERKEAQIQIRRLNRLYAVLSRCDAAVFRATSEQELFDEACRIVVEAGGFPLGWVGRVDRETKAITPVARAGAEAGYLNEVTMEVSNSKFAAGPAGRALLSGQAAACTDFAADPAMEPWRAAAQRHNLRSSVALPLELRGRTAYLLGMYSSEPGFFTGEELSLAEEVGHSLSFALDRLQLERDRAQAERDRRASQERLELALEAANEAYWDWKVGTGEWYISPRFCALVGHARSELTAEESTLIDLVYPDDAAGLDRQLGDLRKGRIRAVTAEFRVRRGDGIIIWVHGTAKAVSQDGKGLPLRIVGTVVDITQRKLLEQQFLQAQKMESIGRLAGGVAHDFNNYLTVINGYASLALGRIPPDSPLTKALTEIQNAGEKSAALTRQLLAFSRKNAEIREVINPNKVILGLEKIVRRLMGENITLELELTPERILVLADPTHLEQVIMNLATNARDAVRQGGHIRLQTEPVQIQSGLHPGKKSGSFLRLSVTDDGSGMTSEVREHIFEPFYTTKDKTHGTGLGLATVYGIVERSEGFIEVDSEPGRGTSFYVYLPRVAAEEALTEPVGVAVPTSAVNPATLLVVEDQDSVRRLTVDILEREGYLVLAAGTGAEALELSGGHAGTIDAIVSDIVMPGMSGPELVAELLKERPAMGVMFVSGYANDEMRQEALGRPGTVFVSKPYSPAILVARVRELLAVRRSVGVDTVN